MTSRLDLRGTDQGSALGTSRPRLKGRTSWAALPPSIDLRSFSLARLAVTPDGAPHRFGEVTDLSVHVGVIPAMFLALIRPRLPLRCAGDRTGRTVDRCGLGLPRPTISAIGAHGAGLFACGAHSTVLADPVVGIETVVGAASRLGWHNLIAGADQVLEGPAVVVRCRRDLAADLHGDVALIVDPLARAGVTSSRDRSARIGTGDPGRGDMMVE